ncbi:MAG: hypothetical protein OSA97_18025 [Nevskia sp.]|nr:hypothetical protein [Nevskia sp.]
MKPVDQVIRSASRAAEPLPEKCCGNCLYHHRNNDDITGRTVLCRRYPPKPYPLAQGQQIATMSMKPIVQQAEWCGEWFMEPAK